MFKPITGEKINLRPLRETDVESIYHHIRDREISRYTFIPYPYLKEYAWEFVRRAEQTDRDGVTLHFGVEDKATGEIIGMVGLEQIDLHNRKVEIGYWLSKHYWRRGITTEAVMLVLGYAFKKMRMKRVFAHVFVGNVASELVLKHCGFTYEGVERASRLRRGKWMDCQLFSILREEYREPRPAKPLTEPQTVRSEI